VLKKADKLKKKENMSVQIGASRKQSAAKQQCTSKSRIAMAEKMNKQNNTKNQQKHRQTVK